jgi:hypothetical protein
MAYQILDVNQNVLETVEDIQAWLDEKGDGPWFAYDDGIFERPEIAGDEAVRVFKLVEEE